MRTVQFVYWQLGIPIGTISSRRAVLALLLVLENEDRLSHLVQQVYIPVAEHFHCNHWKAVERNMRTVIQCAWRRNPQLLCEMAHYPLLAPPTPHDFLTITYNYIVRHPSVVVHENSHKASPV